MITTEQVQDLVTDGGTVLADDGSKIGKVGQVYLDDRTGDPEWVTVKTGMFGSAESFVPLAQADVTDHDVRVPYTEEQVKDAPRVEDADAHLSPDQEAELYRHYGLSYDDAASAPSGDGEGRDTQAGSAGGGTSGPDTDEAMTRSEEQLRVGTERHETGKARLRKYVVTEHVTRTVPVSHEEVRIEREPVTDADRDQALAGGDITEAEHEVTLHEERPVVDKEVVPVERVRMDTETVAGEQQVTEEVRKEQIEADGVDPDAERSGGPRG